MNYLKPYLYLLLYIVLSVILIGLGRELDNGVFKILWQLISFFLILKHRHSISSWLVRFKWPTILVFVLSSLPFMLVEENINCFPTGCKLIPVTIPFLILFLLVIYLVVKRFNIKRFWPVLTVFCLVGMVWEATLGAASAEFRALPPLWIAIFVFWVWMSYAYLTVIPLTYLLEKREHLAK